MFYLMINFANLLTIIVIPLLRQKVHCFGETTCFSLAFGVSAVLVIMSVVIFVSGRLLYKIKKVKADILFLSAKCMCYAMKRKIKMRKEPKKPHVLDYADDKYDHKLIEDIKATLRVLRLCVPIPAYHSLNSQSGSSFLFQATRMNGDIGFTVILPDQLNIFTVLLGFCVVPFLDLVIYPFLKRCKLLTKSIERIEVAGLLKALSFVMAAVVQTQIEKSYPALPVDGDAQIRFYNLLPCSVNVTGLSAQENTVGALSVLVKLHLESLEEKYDVKFKVGDCNGNLKEGTVAIHSVKLTPNGMFGMMLRFKGNHSLQVLHYKDNIDKSTDGYPQVR